MDDFHHEYIDLGEVTLHCVIEGEGPLVLMLHGFPEFWYSWRHQIREIARAGFRVVAPDLRGYNLSSKPKGVESYSLGKLVDDVSRLIKALGAEKATVIAHDWGGIIAWSFAMTHPEQLERLAVLNCPHPVTFSKGLRTLKQLKKSWYMMFFQLPRLPERVARAGRFALFRRTMMREPIRPGAVSAEEADRYAEAMSQPGAIESAINYYRALYRKDLRPDPTNLRPIECPVLIIFGERDRHIGKELADPEPAWVPNARVERIPDASHWVQIDRPERVTTLLREFIRG
ncbi:MAG: alpha/beta fold hydrolase [Polyangiaceae bacterium]